LNGMECVYINAVYTVLIKAVSNIYNASGTTENDRANGMNLSVFFARDRIQKVPGFIDCCVRIGREQFNICPWRRGQGHRAAVLLQHLLPAVTQISHRVIRLSAEHSKLSSSIFLPANAMLARYMLSLCACVCQSVRLPQAVVV